MYRYAKAAAVRRREDLDAKSPPQLLWMRSNLARVVVHLARQYDSIPVRGRTNLGARSKLYTCVLEALYIRHLSPDLYALKKFVLALSLFSPYSSPWFYPWLIAVAC